jgi:5-formyltetrahydrofolate cyclo-ligase
VADEKKYLREILRECRCSLSERYVAAISDAVQMRLMQTAFYREPSTIVLYAATEGEIDTGQLLADAIMSGRRVLMPRVSRENHELVLIPVKEPADLVPGAFGILEPRGTEIVPVSALGPALICVPGVVFSPTGQRIGRGAGYYDKLLASIRWQAVTAGLAYSFQVLDRLPESPADRRLNLIFTESAMHVAKMDDLSVSDRPKAVFS